MEMTEAGPPESSGSPPGGDSYGPVTPPMVEALNETRPWVLFVAVLAFIGAGFMVLAACGMAGIGLFAQGLMGEMGGVGGIGGLAVMLMYGVIYLLAAVLYVAMGYYLYKYATAIQAFADTRETVAMEQALGHQRSFWRMVGIVTIVYLCLIVLGLLAALIIGLVVGFSG